MSAECNINGHNLEKNIIFTDQDSIVCNTVIDIINQQDIFGTCICEHWDKGYIQ